MRSLVRDDAKSAPSRAEEARAGAAARERARFEGQATDEQRTRRAGQQRGRLRRR